MFLLATGDPEISNTHRAGAPFPVLRGPAADPSAIPPDGSSASMGQASSLSFSSLSLASS
jgi:hypothetical protein